MRKWRTRQWRNPHMGGGSSWVFQAFCHGAVWWLFASSAYSSAVDGPDLASLSLSEPRPAFLPCVPQLILDCLAFRYLAFPFVILPYLTLGYLALRTFEWAPHQFKFIFEWAPRQLRFILEWAPRQCRFIFEWAPYYFSASWYILYGPLAPNQSVCNGIRTQSTTTAIAWLQAPYRSSYNRPINSLDQSAVTCLDSMVMFTCTLYTRCISVILV